MICSGVFFLVAVRVIKAALNSSCPQEQPLLWSYLPSARCQTLAMSFTGSHCRDHPCMQPEGTLPSHVGEDGRMGMDMGNPWSFWDPICIWEGLAQPPGPCGAAGYPLLCSFLIVDVKHHFLFIYFFDGSHLLWSSWFLQSSSDSWDWVGMFCFLASADCPESNGRWWLLNEMSHMGGMGQREL